MSVQLLQRQTSKAGDEQTATEPGKIDAHWTDFPTLLAIYSTPPRCEQEYSRCTQASFAIDELIQNIIEDLRSHHPLIEEIVQTEVYGDRERTRQVIRNLLTNTLKYSLLPSENLNR